MSCDFELSERGLRPLILEAKSFVGGRTASWKQDGMPVESGLHRVLGFYEALPAILNGPHPCLVPLPFINPFTPWLACSETMT